MSISALYDEYEHLQEEKEKVREQRDILLNMILDINSKGYVGHMPWHANKFLQQYKLDYDEHDGTWSIPEECDGIHSYENFEEVLRYVLELNTGDYT